jgi:Mce-associated membrane protein
LAVDAGAAAGQLTDEQERVEDEQAPVIDTESPAPQPSSGMRWPIMLGLVIVIALGSLCGWLGYRAYDARKGEHLREVYLEAGRQGALNLATISSNQADADVQRILDSSVGKFHDDFAQRAPAFIDVVKKAQSNTTGSVTAAGLESETPDKADVLVAVAVKTTTGNSPEQQPRSWRMRVTLAKVDDSAKIADVVFVP